MNTAELATFADRRQRLAEAVAGRHRGDPRRAGSAAQRRHRLRVPSGVRFDFLTGFDEPDAVLVLNPAHAKERYGALRAAAGPRDG